MPTTPSLFQSRGLSIHYSPCIATPATDRISSYGDFSEMVDSYSHEHSTWGFDNANIVLKGQWEDLQDWWFTGIGRDIHVKNAALDTVWKGFVNSISVSVGALGANVGPLTEIANYTYVVYTIILDNTVLPIVTGGQTLTTAVLNSESAAKYGQWEKVLTGGTCTKDDAERYRDTHVNEMRLPISSEELNVSGNTQVQLTLECLGYIAWLKAYVYLDATAGTRTISQKIQDVLAYDPNGIFSSDYSYIESNAYLATRAEEDSPFANTVVESNVAIGDVNDHRYTFGIWEDQIAKYRDVTTLPTRYEHYLTDDKVRVAEYGGGYEVDYPDVRAGEWLFVGDFLEGHAPDNVDRRNDNRFIFAERVGFSLPDSLTINGAKVSTIPQLLAKQGLGGS